MQTTATATPRTNYQKCRDQIKTGDLILFESRDIVSKAITLFTGSPITHAAMAAWVKTPEGKNRLFIIESVLPGVCLNFLSNRNSWWLPHGDMYWHKIRPEHARLGNAAADLLMQKVGTFYDFKNLMFQAFKRVVVDAKKLVCSEAVAYPWVVLLERGNEFVSPYPHELALPKFGIYELEGVKIT
jgi:hypothetical protein